MTTTTLTTGQAAKLAGLCPATVNRLIDQGFLKGWRVPGSNHRRVTPEALVKFLVANGMPMPEELRPYKLNGS